MAETQTNDESLVTVRVTFTANRYAMAVALSWLGEDYLRRYEITRRFATVQYRNAMEHHGPDALRVDEDNIDAYRLAREIVDKLWPAPSPSTGEEETP